MDATLFSQFRELIHRESGIALSSEKIPLLQTRINKRLRALNISDPKSYLDLVLNDKSGEEIVRLIDVVSTNVTYFFREPEHFTFLADAFARAKDQNIRDIKIWCAAASSGEEPYTLALTAKERFCSPERSCRILGTDISLTVLEKAQRGQYVEEQFQHVPPAMKAKYFVPQDPQNGEQVYEASPELKQLLLFKRLNLSKFPYPLKGGFDFIFCRNVMIYFDQQLRAKIVKEFDRLLNPGGYLIVSKTESLLGAQHSLKSLGNSIYQKE